MKTKIRAAPLLPVAAVTAGLEILVRAGWLPEYLVPKPSSVISVFWYDRDMVLQALSETAAGTCAGLALSASFGFAIAVGFSQSNALRRMFLPYAVFFQTVPVIALAPLLVIWFGYGLPTVIVSATIVSIFPMIANTLVGLTSADEALLDFFRLQNATHWQTLRYLKIPSARPYMFTGLRIAAGLSVIGAIVGEFVGGGGLGGLVDVARTQQRVDQVFAAVLLASALGLILVAGIDFLAEQSVNAHQNNDSRR